MSLHSRTVRLRDRLIKLNLLISGVRPTVVSGGFGERAPPRSELRDTTRVFDLLKRCLEPKDGTYTIDQTTGLQTDVLYVLFVQC